MSVGRAGPPTLIIVLMILYSKAAFGEEASSTIQVPTVAVLGITGSPSKAALVAPIEDALSKAARNEKINIAGREEILSRSAIALPDAERGRIDELRHRAQEHILQFEFEQARSNLDEARRILLARHADVLCHTELGVVDLELAGFLLDMSVQGEADVEVEADAYRVLLEALRCHPHLSPSPNDFGPRLIEAWETVLHGNDLPVDVERRPRSAQRIVQAADAADLGFVITGQTIETDVEATLRIRISLLRVDGLEELSQETVPLGSRATWERTLGPVIRRMFNPLRAQQPHQQQAELPGGRVLVLSNPSGATVEVDGVEVEEPTPTVLTVDPGLHSLTMTLGGYEIAELDVTVWARQTHPVEVRLEPLDGGIGRRFWWVWTLIGAVTVGAAAGLITWGVRRSQERPDANIIETTLFFTAGSDQR